MFGLPFFDVLVIAAYSLVTIGLGLLAMKRIKTQEDFFLGGRRFGKWLQTFSAFGQSTSSENVVATVTNAYRDGAGGIWSQLMLLWATPFYWFTAPWYRRMRLLTMGDFFRERYGSPRMAMFYAALASFYLIILIGVSLKAVVVTVQGITLKDAAAFTPEETAERDRALRLDTLARASAAGALAADEQAELRLLRAEKPRREFSHLDANWLVAFIVLVVLVYSLAGGLEGAVWNDALQSVLIIILSLLLIPFAISKLNLLHGGSGIMDAGRALHAELPGYFFAPLGSAEAADFTWYFILALSLMATLNVAVQANQFTANASARDEFAARVGFTTGNYMKRVCTVLWGFGGLLFAALYARELQQSDLAWGHATRDLLGPAGFGLVGLMIACLLAALQSTASSLMVSASALFTKNVYEPLRGGLGERHYLRVARVCGALLLICSALLSTAFGTMLDMLKFMWEFNAMTAASFWCGVKWRGATRPGAWASLLTALALFMALPALLPAIFPQMRTAEAFLRRTQPVASTHEYPATQRDVTARAAQIAAWAGPGAPPPLALGETVRREIVQPPRSIYWTQDIKLENGAERGQGLFNIEMFVLDRVFDLSGNPRALNETIRYAYKILLPFAVLIAVSWLTRAPMAEQARRFYIRMRVRVRPDRAEDERVVAAAYAAPETTEGALLFPRTQLEFHKWDREDTLGFFAAVGVALSVVALLLGLLSIGAE